MAWSSASVASRASRHLQPWCQWPRGAGLAFLLCAALPALAQPPTTTLVYPPWKHCYGLHRVTQTHLTLRAGFRYRFDNPQGICALKLVAEDDTSTTRDDDELTVFGVNSGQNMLIYNTSLTSIAFYGGEGEGPGEFRHPTGIAASADGTVIVADTGNNRLHVLHYEDDALHHVRFIEGSFASLPLRRPIGVALESGSIYLCDSGNDRILVLELDGSLQRELRPQLRGHAFLQEPFSLTVLRSNSEYNHFGTDAIVVSDSSNSRLVQLRHDGSIVAVRRCRDLGPSVGHFDWVAFDYHANVYVSDRGGRLHKFDRRLQYLVAIGRPGTGEYEFDEPRGIGLYRRFGQMFVAERRGAQYLWIGTDVFNPRVSEVRWRGNAWEARVRFFVTEYARLELDWVDPKGDPRAVLQGPRWTPPGPFDGRFRFVLPPDDRNLRLRVRASPTYSARKYLQIERDSALVRFAPGDSTHGPGL